MTVCFMFGWVYWFRVNSFKNGDADQEGICFAWAALPAEARVWRATRLRQGYGGQRKSPLTRQMGFKYVVGTICKRWIWLICPWQICQRWNWHLFPVGEEVVKASSGHNPQPFLISIFWWKLKISAVHQLFLKNWCKDKQRRINIQRNLFGINGCLFFEGMWGVGSHESRVESENPVDAWGLLLFMQGLLKYEKEYS